MQHPVILGFYGESRSGKTTLLQKIITFLSVKGYHIATVKQSDKTLSIDSKGKDTWKHAEAGADLVVFLSKSETDFLIKKKMSIHDSLAMICDFDGYDIILIEGARDPTIKKIRIGSKKKRPNTIIDYAGDIEEIIMYIEQEVKKERLKEKEKKPDEELLLYINEKKIQLSQFPSMFIRNSLLGMVSSLKGVNDIRTMKIEYKKKEPGDKNSLEGSRYIDENE